MHVLITGANGFVGKNLQQHLSERPDVQIKCFTRDHSAADLLSLLADADIVFHLAGMVYIGSKKLDILYDVNVNGTKNIINACFNSSVKKLIYVSSVHAFSEPKILGLRTAQLF